MDLIAELTLPAILFGLTLAFGLWLSRVGKPYKLALFNVHKLLALGTVILAVIRLARILPVPASMPVIIGLLIIEALGAALQFFSGALLSAGKLDYASMLTIHRIAAFVLLLATVPTITLMTR